MSANVIIEFSRDVHQNLWSHLLPKIEAVEQAAFVFATYEDQNTTKKFKCIDWYAVPPEGFVTRSKYYLELTDGTRAYVIKRAHDLKASLIEFHSHTSHWQAQFSASDLSGFEDFVPHVWWRLKDRPYASVVVTKSGFDAFAWIKDPKQPEYLEGIMVDDKLFKPTKLSSLNYHDDERTL